MKRNIDLIKTILQAFEDHTGVEGRVMQVSEIKFIAKTTDNFAHVTTCDFYNAAIKEKLFDSSITVNDFYNAIMLIYDLNLTDMELSDPDKITNRTNVVTLNFSRLLSKGHDYLDVMRDSKTWDSIKEKAKNAPLEVLFDLGKALLKKKGSELLGIE